jgi:hypothetical protein
MSHKIKKNVECVHNEITEMTNEISRMSDEINK